MKRKLLWLMTCASIGLCGCTKIDEFIDDKVLGKSGLETDENYENFQNNLEESRIDDEGYYSESFFYMENDDESIEKENAAHVTFSTNSYLSIEYYLDENHSKKIDQKNCFFSQGDKIYAKVNLKNDLPSSEYQFSGFRIIQYDEDMKRNELKSVPADSNLVLEINQDLLDSELSIEPIGTFTDRTIKLEDYYTDESGKHALSGTWSIDDRQYSDGQAVISPVSSYIISYDYDSDEYFYVSSEPECFYINNDDGMVIFKQRDAMDETVNYSVELHKYYELSINSKQSRKVLVLKGSAGTNGELKPVTANNDVKVDHIKYGDEVFIITDTKWDDLWDCKEMYCLSEEKTSYKNQACYKYKLIVPQKGGEFEFNPSDYQYEHGKIVFKCFGEVVTGTKYLAQKARITYEASETEDGYILANGENGNVIEVTDKESTINALNSIHFIKEVKSTVDLKQPQYGGRIRYYVDGEEITTKEYNTKTGTEITMKFESWEGWYTNHKNGEKYTVCEASSQSPISDINAIFVEDKGHKPELKIVLEESVGEDMKFEVAASGFADYEFQYSKPSGIGGVFDTDDIAVSDAPIGTEKGIELNIGNKAIPYGKAVKVKTTKVDKNNNEYNEIRLLNDLTEPLSPINVYDDDELGKSIVTYKSITITISLVDVVYLDTINSVDHASVSVKNAETMETLSTGDYLENGNKVLVTITPNEDYYVSGKHVENNVYTNSMKIEEFVSNQNEIIEDHPVKQYIHVSLDSKDEYGECIFSIDGVKLSETEISAKEGQKLTLEYKITTDGYCIYNSDTKFFWESKYSDETSKSITIDSSHNGNTFDRGTFEIEVGEKED